MGAHRGRVRDNGRDYDDSPRKSDEREHVASMRAQNRRAKTNYELGRQGDKPFDWDELSDDERQAFHAGESDAAQERERKASSGSGGDDSSSSSASDASGLPRVDGSRRASSGGTRSTSSMVADGSGFLLGLIAYAALINFIRGGPGQLRGWIGAKFLNRPYGATAGAQPATPAAPARPSVVPAAPTGAQLIPASYSPPTTAPIQPGILR